MFCNRQISEGATEKDEILRGFHIAALSEEKNIPEKHDIQNQVV
jgi:hypothetical protein